MNIFLVPWLILLIAGLVSAGSPLIMLAYDDGRVAVIMEEVWNVKKGIVSWLPNAPDGTFKGVEADVLRMTMGVSGTGATSTLTSKTTPPGLTYAVGTGATTRQAVIVMRGYPADLESKIVMKITGQIGDPTRESVVNDTAAHTIIYSFPG